MVPRATQWACLCALLGTCFAVVSPPTFIVDLDRPAGQRWNGAVHAVLARHDFAHSFEPVFSAHNATLFSHLEEDHYDLIATSVQQHFPDQAAELRGIAAEFQRAGHAVTFEYLCAWVWFHELDHSDFHTDFREASAHPAQVDTRGRECTAIVAQSRGGEIVHARNMDQHPTAVRNCTLRLTFRRGGATLFEAVDWYWLTTGVMTAVRRGGVSLQENWRFCPPQPRAEVLGGIGNGTMPQVFFFRHLLSAPAPPTFPEALEAAQRTAFTTPMYVVLAGTRRGEGAIVTRGARNFTTLRLDEAADGNESFFLVQTNYDQPGPDCASDARRTKAEETMRSLGQDEGSTQLGVFAAVSTPPVLNDGTAYTAVMRAATGELHAFVRDSTAPP